MTKPEFLAWAEFYKLHPFDDHARIHRPAALVAHAMNGVAIDDLVGVLEPEQRAAVVIASGYSDADLATFKAFGRKPPLRASADETRH